MARQVKCPKCGAELFAAFLIGGSDGDTRNYINLICIPCDREMQFVVDLTPEFERQSEASPKDTSADL